MQKFQETVINYLKKQLPKIEISVHKKAPDFLTFTHKEWPWGILIIFHHLDESQEVHFDKIAYTESKSKIKVIHLWEDLWNYHREKVKSRLLSSIGKSDRIHGRETKIISLNNVELIEFLAENHLNVPLKGKYKYGLSHQGSLVAVMSFSKGRMINRSGENYNSFELLRFCNKLNCTVVGGFTKLLDHFIKTIKPDDIMTYVDKDWSDGQAYEKAGFELVDHLPPIEFWLNEKTNQREYQQKSDCQELHKVDKKSNLILNEGCLKVINSGSYKYIRRLR